MYPASYQQQQQQQHQQRLVDNNKKNRILIVDDDNPDNNTTLKLDLERNGFIVDTFRNPQLHWIISELVYLIWSC